jgi:hypothetical protein
LLFHAHSFAVVSTAALFQSKELSRELFRLQHQQLVHTSSFDIISTEKYSHKEKERSTFINHVIYHHAMLSELTSALEAIDVIKKNLKTLAQTKTRYKRTNSFLLPW